MMMMVIDRMRGIGSHHVGSGHLVRTTGAAASGHSGRVLVRTVVVVEVVLLEHDVVVRCRTTQGRVQWQQSVGSARRNRVDHVDGRLGLDDALLQHKRAFVRSVSQSAGKWASYHSVAQRQSDRAVLAAHDHSLVEAVLDLVGQSVAPVLVSKQVAVVVQSCRFVRLVAVVGG